MNRHTHEEDEGKYYHPNTCRNCGKETDCVYCEDCASKARCPHGKRVGHCDTCDYESDVAYDAMREGRR